MYDATCRIQESGERVSVRCTGKQPDGRAWRTVEEGTLEKSSTLQTTALARNGRRFSVRRELVPNATMFREVRRSLDTLEEEPLEAYYQRVPDPIRCTDVTQLDFKNLTFNSDAILFAFHDGVAEEYVWEGLATAGENQTAPKPEFRSEIEFDKPVTAEGGVTVRFLGIVLDHLTGSGWRNYVFGFTCTQGLLREVFRRDALSLRVESLTDADITVSMLPFGGRNTAKWWRYKWSSGARRYQLERVWLTPQRLCKPSTLMPGQCYEATH